MYRIILVSLLLAFCAVSPALAQTNPPVAACGLPAEGNIFASVTYTLSADCVQTGRLAIASGNPKNSVTVNGNGHTITGGAFLLFFGNSAALNLNNVTIAGATGDVIQVETLNASNTTFTGIIGVAVSAQQSNLNNVLFSRNSSNSFQLGGNAVSLNVRNTTSHTLTNVVFRNNIGNGGAAVVHSGGTLTTNGCLTLSGNAPYDVYVIEGGTWTDNSTGPCSGTIGNGGQAAIPPPQLMACGFPAPGNLDVSATYTLTADCDLNGVYYISEDVSINIGGNGRALRSSRTNYSFYISATSSLRLENIALEGVRILNYGDFKAERIKISAVVDGMANVGEARFTNALFEGNRANSPSSRSVALAYKACPVLGWHR